jgi:aspartyl protease
MSARRRRSPGRSLALLAALLAVGCVAPAVVERPAPFQVPTTRLHGLFLTRVRIDGREVGPFVLDSGAAEIVLDVKLAATLGLRLWGETVHPESAGPVHFARLESLELGWVRLPRPNVVVTDFSTVSQGMGRPLAGVLGAPFFNRAVVVFDYPAGTVTCVPPGAYALPHGQWQPITFWKKLPLLRGRLPGGVNGMFVLDTGSTSPLMLYPHFVRRNLALAIRQTGKGRGVGMAGFYDVVEGRVGWLEVGGQPFDRPAVMVMQKDVAVTQEDDEMRDGIIGYDLLRGLTVVLNYPESKLAFLR